ncbi:glycosyltransferase [bacterium]|nr:glycosyltransferase [candidate division CSSED10-310 bacterium]
MARVRLIWLSRARFTETKDFTIVIYSIIPWSGVWQRPQHFATLLAKHNKVIYVDPAGVQHVLANRLSAHHTVQKISDNLVVYRPRVLPGGKTKSRVIELNDYLILAGVLSLLKRFCWPRPILVTNTPLADFWVEKFPWKAVVYDVIDDFVSTSWAPLDAKSREIRLFNKTDTVFTGTYSLWVKKKSYHKDIEYIPCGVETEHFLKSVQPETLIPQDVELLARPILGYFGALNERIDADLLIFLAKSIPGASVLLIGPVFADFGLSDFTDRWASVLPNPAAPGFRLKSHPPNIHIIGIRPYRDLPAYLKAFDVCLLPYVINQVTQDIHPVKILEYLASGKPVVSTALPDVMRFYKQIVDIAHNRNQFIDLINRNIVDQSEQRKQERIAFAAPKTWEQMAERMYQKISVLISQ